MTIPDPSMSKSENSKESTNPVPTKKPFWEAVFECMRNDPNIDYEKLANLTGYRNATTAAVTYHRKKAVLMAEGSSSPNKSKIQKKPSPKNGDVVPGDATVRRRGRPPKTIDAVPENATVRRRGRPPKKIERNSADEQVGLMMGREENVNQ